MIQFAFLWAFILLPLPLIIWLAQKNREPELSPIRTPLFASWQAMQAKEPADKPKMFSKK